MAYLRENSCDFIWLMLSIYFKGNVIKNNKIWIGFLFINFKALLRIHYVFICIDQILF